MGINKLADGRTVLMPLKSNTQYRKDYVPVADIPEVLWGIVQEVDVNVRTPTSDRFEIKPRPRGFPLGRKLA